MFKRIFSWLLVLALLLGMTGNVLAAESKPAVSQIVTMQNQEGVTVRLTVPRQGRVLEMAVWSINSPRS